MTSAFDFSQSVLRPLSNTGILLALGCFLAYRTRNLDPVFGEAKQLGLAMYNTAFTMFTTTVLVEKILDEETAQSGIQTIGVVWATMFGATVFVVPRVLQIRDERRSDRWERRASSRMSFANSSLAGGSNHRVIPARNDMAAHRASWLLPETSPPFPSKVSAANSDERRSSDSIIVPIPEQDSDLEQSTSLECEEASKEMKHSRVIDSTG